MPCRPLLVDLGSGARSLCQSCLYSLRLRDARIRQPRLPRVALYRSQAALQIRTRPWAGVGQKRRPVRLQAVNAPPDSAGDVDGNHASDFTVRYFEQEGSRRIELPEQTFGRSPDGSVLKDALLRIKDSLETKEQKDTFQSVLQDVGGTSWADFSSAQGVKQSTERLRAYAEAIDSEIEKVTADLPQEALHELRHSLSSELPLLPSRAKAPQVPETPWTTNQRRKIVRLNAALARAFRDQQRGTPLEKKMVSSVYRAYHAARLSLAQGWNQVPGQVWQLLWTVFSADESINSHRLSHLSLLARDMSEAKVALTPSQQILTMEALFVDGWEAKAIAGWKRCITTLGANDSDVFQEFWELGVRMYCRAGDVDRAEKAASTILAKGLNPRILLPLIQAFAQQRDAAEGQHKAWTTYRQLRQLLGKEMTLTDYDQVVSCFLTASQTENALHAFVDMMTNGEIDLKQQQKMPSVIANKFFLGKWLKRLIGAGDLDGAFSVVEYMRERGVNAAPIHLNGLIGAWQRSGGADNLEKADKLAWDMIASRIEFVRTRKSDSPTTRPSTTPWPRATRETFSLLAENYCVRNLLQRLETLWAAFGEAELRADSFMMNQLLESYYQAGQPRDALALYRWLVAENGVAPDPHTFSIMWKMLAVNRLHIVAPDAVAEETVAARRLFAEMTSFRELFEPDGIEGHLGRKILHSFRRLGDKAGFLVALTALREVFHFLPPETLVLELVLGTTRLSVETAEQRRRLMVAKRALDKSLARARRTTDDGPVEHERRRRQILYEHLQRVYWPADDGDGKDEDHGRRRLVEAAEMMGVYDVLRPGAGTG